jgi:hypothetical protein
MNKPSLVSRWGLTCCLLAALACATLLSGCAAQGSASLAITSQSERGAILQGRFTTALYRFDSQNQVTMLLLDGPPEAPSQAVTVHMFWTPRAGRTPIDPTATNATIHYVIFAGDHEKQAGVYSGAGFVFPHSQPGGNSFSADIWQSTLRLTDATAGFKDLLGPADLQGSITVKHDDVAMEKMLRLLNIKLHDTLGYPRLVNSHEQQPVQLATTR